MNLQEITGFLSETDQLILTTHENPDGDGLGAEYALCSALRESGKNVCILNSEPPAHKYSFIDQKQLIRTIGQNGQFPDDLSQWNLLILDAAADHVGSGGKKLVSDCRKVAVIDHHDSSGKHPGWLMPEASSTCEMVFQLLEHMNIEIGMDSAVALFAGIVYDTGSFVYPKTQSETFRIAQTLVSAGVVPNYVYSQLYENKSKGSLMLQSLVTSTMVLYENDRIALQMMPRETLIASGAQYDESQELVNIPLQCADVRISVFFKENELGEKRCSFRSKGELDCAALATQFGGGGHRTAAGFRFSIPFSRMQKKVLDAICLCFT